MIDETSAVQVAQAVLGRRVVGCERFPTGLRHWVYDVELEDGERVVVRLADPDYRDELAGGLFWRAELDAVGVSVPELLAFDVDGDQPYMILQRLPGTDLGNAIDALHNDELERIASTVADMQRRAGQLRRGTGFGYALDYDTPLHSSWFEVLEASVERSTARIADAGVVDPVWVGRVREQLPTADGSFDDVEPTAFLHDATTKNVIVSGGRVTGLVDTDEMAFGDPLWAIALTRMSLLSAGRPTAYAEMLAAAMRYEPGERLDLYTAVFALDFLAELGQRFNRDDPVAGSTVLLERLTSVIGEH